MSPSPSVLAVSRIAYLASDVVINSLSSAGPSPFASAFNALAASPHTRAAVKDLPFGADAGASLLRHRSAARLLSYTTLAHPQALNNLLLHLPELSSTPTVFHIAVGSDLSDALVLLSSLPFVLYSRTAQQAHDHALLASRLAFTESIAVLHIFHLGDVNETFDSLDEDSVPAFLLSEKRSLSRSEQKPSTDPAGLLQTYQSAALATVSLLRRPLRPFAQHGASEPHTVVFTLGRATVSTDIEGVAFVDVALLKPLPSSAILGTIPPSTTRVIVLEQVHRWSMKWTPLYLEVASAIQQSELPSPPVVQSGVLGDASSLSGSDIGAFLQRAASESPSARLSLGPSPSSTEAAPATPPVPRHESAYTKMLHNLFSDRLEILNAPELVASQGQAATTPEFALGRARGDIEEREELVSAVQDLLRDSTVSLEIHALLSRWLGARDDGLKSKRLGEELVAAIQANNLSSPAAQKILQLRRLLPALSRWIIGSDAWAYDLGASGLHHAVASKLNVNILILDTTPYTSRNTVDPHRRKQDVGLYAMNHGDVYVASTAVYSSYSQVLQAIMEADRYDGPSVVLAYLPYNSEETPALEILKETKLAVDSGYWPLYRWNPAREREGKEPFSLDSDFVKNELQAFLDRQNHLSQLVRSKPEIASELVGSLGENLKQARKQRAAQAYNDLLAAIDAPPLTVLYASDGGKAEKVAKRLATRGKMRGLSTTVATVDSISIEDLAKEEMVAFVTSVAGQGEFPQNGRSFIKALNALAAKGERPLTNVKYAVFGMGDSHYWPRPEDAHYYNKAGKDLDVRLEQLGATRFAPLGLGDDQDADGPETGYKAWEPLLWKALGVDAIEVKEAEPEPITNEHIKVASQYLRGTIAEGLEDTTTGALAPSDTQLTKFHGIYQQDDRDIRDERQAQGVEPAYGFMIRVRMPGGVCLPEQWLIMDQIADEHGNGTFKITTRQTFQFHGVIKRHLKSAIQDINRALLDTLAACGDVNRNVIVSTVPSLSKLHRQAYDFARRVSEHLLPRTTAYHEIWLDKKLVAGDALKDVEPLYGQFYLPRKFKIAVAIPPNNDVDVFANDVGFIAIIDDKGELAGFNVTAGGGMGVTHGNKKTYPRIGDVLGFCTVEQGVEIAEKIMLVQRDNGNRADRKNARLKYTIDRMGLDNFKAAVEKLLGYQFQPARPFSFDKNIDEFGWITGQDGRHHFTCFIENGRIQDEPEKDFKTGLREIAKVHKGAFRMTANQHLIISDVATEDLPTIKGLLAKYKLDNLAYSGLRLSSSACVAFPTCGLAMAESERYLPILIDKVEKICEENGLRNDSIVMRMTGCPNGCARPYLAEVAFVGKAPGSYLMLLGGGYYGQRMNKVYRETVTEPEILAILQPMIKRYALERHEGEHFGDFVIRAGYIAPTTSGKEWYDRMGGEGQHREISVGA
ncbi:sulfite reductase subunit beta [Dichomitus squalens LYAD-421 SS1]|uniref:sulfite reductase subunit beta n=1 Tax=Dichomitus squalens (strain LYAD-421) TaxID=732165 RepID=UPI0004415AB9|nr:sulfite reductase subunit beta [Dichomitus squalens LYAD-421 SS1]EJF64144.1 sulfite reductase subunit beta [Dichomitus squalens LYAD-421 SS1]